MKANGQLLRWLNQPLPSRRGQAENRLPSVDEFRRILERERLRADRNQGTFSLLSLTFPKQMEAGTGVAQAAEIVVRILGQRLRATDEPGWLADRCIGIMLPDTTAQGAWKLAEDIGAEFRAHAVRPVCDVYQYPNGDSPSTPSGQREPVDATKMASASPCAKRLELLYVQRLPVWKRLLDIVGSCTALLLFSPVMLATAALIKLTFPGPVFFRQLRDGLGGKPFTIYKFRTMHVGADSMKAELRQLSEQDGPAFKLTHDPRCTRIGPFLRKTSLDELPQLFNVLKGDMSLVGPRPLPVDESSACEGWQRRRLCVTPGLTCIWQIEGRSVVSFAVWMRMDLEYIRSRSIWRDAVILFKTVPAVILGTGAR